MRVLVDIDNSSFPHPNFSDAINRNIVQAEIEGGVHLNDVPPGTVLEVQTKNHTYTIIHKACQALISGHPEFCPDPVEVQSTLLHSCGAITVSFTVRTGAFRSNLSSGVPWRIRMNRRDGFRAASMNGISAVGNNSSDECGISLRESCRAIARV